MATNVNSQYFLDRFNEIFKDYCAEIGVCLPLNFEETFLAFSRDKFLPFENIPESATKDTSVPLFLALESIIDDPEYALEVQKIALSSKTTPMRVLVDKEKSETRYCVPQTQPSTVLMMIALLNLGDGMESILEIGSGSGWVTAMLSKHCKKMYGAEVFDEISTFCREKIEEFKCENVEIHTVNKSQVGLTELAPFERIIVSCGMPYDRLKETLYQLAIGGVAVIPVSISTLPESLINQIESAPNLELLDENVCILMRITRISEDQVTAKLVTYCQFVPLL